MPAEALYKIQSISQQDYDIADKPVNFVAKEDTVLFRVNFWLDWNREEKTVVHTASVYFLRKDTEEQLLRLELNIVFYIDNYEQIIAHTGDVVNTPDSLLLEIFSITVSTARGVIFVRTEDTFLSRVVLGAINPLEMLARMKTSPAEEVQRE